MKVFHDDFELATSGQNDIRDITDMVRAKVRGTGVQNGIVTVFVPDATGAVTTMEYEPGAIDDLRRTMERLVPAKADYHHNDRWDDGNGYSHIRAALMGPELTVPIDGGKLLLGTWQQVVFCDFDNKTRNRTLRLVILGQ